MQTQTSNTLHNANMEAGSKDRPPMLAPGWIDKEIPISEGSPITRTERFQETYKNVSQDIRDQLNAEAKAVQIILTLIDNDIYSTVDACPNACAISQQAVTRNRGKPIVNSPQPIYDQESSMVAKDDETSKNKEIDKLIALISLSFKKIYKPTNNLRTSSNTSRANQDNYPRINRSAGYENQRISNVDGARETVGSTASKLIGGMTLMMMNWKIKNWKCIICTWHNFKRFLQKLLILDLSLMMNHCKREEIDQNDDDNDLANERELLASLIEKLKCEIDENKNRNKFLETSNKVLIEQLKDEIKDFKNKNKSLESSNNHFKEANNKLSETNNLLYTDYKKSEAKLERRNSREYASQMEIECEKKEAQIKLYKTQEDKELDKVIECLNEETVADLRYFNSLELEVDSLRSQLETQKIQFLKEIDRLSREYYYADHINAILSVYTRLDELVEIILFIVDSGCSKRMTGNLKLLINFVEKFLGTVKFGNDQIAPILGYGDLVQGAVTIKRVYYVEGLNHNLFFVGQFCDADLEVAFKKSTCYIRDLKRNDLLTGKAKRKTFHTKLTPSSKRRLQLLHMDLCGPMRVASINGKRYVLVIIDDYSRYTWTHFLRSKDETPKILIDFLRLVQRGHQAQVRIVRTDKGTEFLNQTLHAYFAAEGIHHQMSVARTPEQNGVVERRNRTLVEAARTMLSATKVPLFFWAEAIATACFTQNRSLEKGDECIFVGYSTQSRAYGVFNKRTRVIMESIHLNFDELPHMASDHISSDPVPECQRMALEHDNLSPAIQRQENVPQVDKTVTTSNELDLLFSLMFDELLNRSSKVMSKSSVVCSFDAPNQQHTTPLNNHTTPAPTCEVPTLAPTVTSSENINQVETYAENDQVTDDEFINIFCTPAQDRGETSSRHVDSSNMHTFYQRYPFEHRWIKDHPLEHVIGNLSQSVRTRRQLESDSEICMFALTVSQTKPKNIKEAMADSAWIESMQEELHQFDRLDVWELVDRPLCINVINLKWLWKNKRDEDGGDYACACSMGVCHGYLKI
nr:hypothetical protein [Tanacetum cinerariifolium]